MAINYDKIGEVELALKEEQNKLLRTQLKIKQLKMVIKAHKEDIYNPKLFEELMKRCKEA